MDAKPGSRLAQLANARKEAEAAAELTPEDLERIELDRAIVQMNALHRILQPHVDEFNESVDESMRLSLEPKPPAIGINQGLVRLLTIEMTPKAARSKRRGDNYTSDDYLAIVPDSAGAIQPLLRSSGVKAVRGQPFCRARPDAGSRSWRLSQQNVSTRAKTER